MVADPMGIRTVLEELKAKSESLLTRIERVAARVRGCQASEGHDRDDAEAGRGASGLRGSSCSSPGATPTRRFRRAKRPRLK